MLKRILCLMTALALLIAFVPAVAEEYPDGALTMEELTEWVAGFKAMAMESTPYNNPYDPESYSEDGYAFIYDFGTLYMDRPEMTEEAVVRALVVTSYEVPGPRGVGVDYLTSEVLDAFYNENESLAGDESFAALYLSDTMPTGALWAWVQRDGQRVHTIQYAIHDQLTTGGEGYTDAGLIFTMQADSVAAIRAYGLDARVSEDVVLANIEAVQEVAACTDYVQVPLSYSGAAMPLTREDLVFSGVDFVYMTPESAEAALGAASETIWVQDDNGEYLCTMEFPSCSVTFIFDQNKQNPRPYMMLIDLDRMEGPRAVRLGDTFASVFNRFRHGEGTFDGVSSETLYGTEGTAPWGVATYGMNADATLRYAVETERGTIVLHMTFETMMLSEIMLYMQ